MVLTRMMALAVFMGALLGLSVKDPATQSPEPESLEQQIEQLQEECRIRSRMLGFVYSLDPDSEEDREHLKRSKNFVASLVRPLGEKEFNQLTFNYPKPHRIDADGEAGEIELLVMRNSGHSVPGRDIGVVVLFNRLGVVQVLSRETNTRTELFDIVVQDFNEDGIQDVGFRPLQIDYEKSELVKLDQEMTRYLTRADGFELLSWPSNENK